jgi:hypothetical protein
MSKWIDKESESGRLKETKDPKSSADTKGNFWTTLPGILTALATLVVAITGFVAVLKQTERSPSPNPTETSSPKPSP